jgi:hypothetical protein
MSDGTFASPREHLEWFPRGKILVYKVAGVQRCPDIVQFASGDGRESFCSVDLLDFNRSVQLPRSFLPPRLDRHQFGIPMQLSLRLSLLVCIRWIPVDCPHVLIGQQGLIHRKGS